MLRFAMCSVGCAYLGGVLCAPHCAFVYVVRATLLRPALRFVCYAEQSYRKKRRKSSPHFGCWGTDYLCSMQLSKNFSLAEMTKSVTAKRLGIDNTPNEEQIAFLRELCEAVLQPLRDHIGPVSITSGLRVPALNRAVGGSGTSQHCALNGAAADIDMDAKNTEVFNYIKDNLVFDQLIWEFGNDKFHDWVHVSYNYGHNRGQVLKAIKQNGKTKYVPYK